MLPARTFKIKRRNLPHWDTDEGTYFVTFRLGDALPANVARRIAERKRAHKLADRLLDRGYGSCVLKAPKIADLVTAALHHFDDERYHLHAFTVMPNHVHVAFRSKPGFARAEILKSWKGFTGWQINRLLNQKGSLWQDESYDSVIHDQNDLDRTIEYIVRNPIRAKLDRSTWTAVVDREFRFS